jgi:hypothetical protein
MEMQIILLNSLSDDLGSANLRSTEQTFPMPRHQDRGDILCGILIPVLTNHMWEIGGMSRFELQEISVIDCLANARKCIHISTISQIYRNGCVEVRNAKEENKEIDDWRKLSRFHRLAIRFYYLSGRWRCQGHFPLP